MLNMSVKREPLSNETACAAGPSFSSASVEVICSLVHVVKQLYMLSVCIHDCCHIRVEVFRQFYFYASANVVAGGIMFLECSCVHLSVRA